MIGWLTGRKRLSPGSRKKLMVAMARAEEAIVETHVSNIFELADALADEVEIDRAVEIYVDRMNLDENLAASVTNRLLARLDAGPREVRPRRRVRAVG